MLAHGDPLVLARCQGTLTPMGKGKNPWQAGSRAWERLNGWHQDRPSATPGHPDDGESALDALADVGRVRHLLDQAELVAVRTARRHGRSWAEIATKLGVTRQSAWERWRDLDEQAPSTAEQVPSTADGDLTMQVNAATAALFARSAASGSDDVPAEIIERAARERRRSSSVTVPNVVGMSWDDARQALRGKRLIHVSSDPDAPPAADDGSNWVVTDQSPESGARVPAGSQVRLWAERRGGGSGVREPRRPKPAPRVAREMRPEPSSEAVG